MQRRPLNQEQVEILELLVKFRFVTVATLKDYFYESNPGMNVFKRLKVLEKRGFMAKRYFDHYRLLHKPVCYYLLPNGARKVAEYRQEDDTDTINIKAVYRDSLVSERFAVHCVAVLKLFNRLTEQYGDDLDFLSKSDQASLHDFPNPPADAYVTLQTGGNVISHYFLEVLDDDTHLLIDASKKIKRYISYRRTGSWAVTGLPFPKIIFVCNSEATRNRVQKHCQTILNKAWVMDIRFATATIDTIKLAVN